MNTFDYLSRKKFSLITIVLALLLSLPLLAQTKFHNPKKTIKNDFWGKLYLHGGKTFYCKQKFSHKTMVLSPSYVVTESTIRSSLNCSSSWDCSKNEKTYDYIISDLHNIVPTTMMTALKLRHAVYEELGAGVTAGSCGLKKTFDRFEPDDSIKGDIARILAYMKVTYHLNINGSVSLIKRWNKLDPVSKAERKRDAEIKKIQGNSNPFVIHPEKINELKGD